MLVFARFPPALPTTAAVAAATLVCVRIALAPATNRAEAATIVVAAAIKAAEATIEELENRPRIEDIDARPVHYLSQIYDEQD